MKYQSIVFSGLPGAGKSTLVAKLQEIYSWRLLSIGDIFRRRWIEKYPDRKISFEDYWRQVADEEIVKLNVEARDAFSKKNIIGDSRYTIYLRDLPIFLVFMSADIDVRATRAFGLEKYGGKSIEEIKSILARRESDEMAVAKKLFGYDYRESHYYDLVINSGRLTVEEEIAVIQGVIQNGDISRNQVNL